MVIRMLRQIRDVDRKQSKYPNLAIDGTLEQLLGTKDRHRSSKGWNYISKQRMMLWETSPQILPVVENSSRLALFAT